MNFDELSVSDECDSRKFDKISVRFKCDRQKCVYL